MVLSDSVNLASGGPTRGAAGGSSQRFFSRAGILTVALALLTTGVTFVILTDMTPIRPESGVTLVLTAVNAVLILVLIGLIGREIYRVAQARSRGKAASRLHVRLVVLFSLVAAVPAMIVAIVASITLDMGLDRWFEMRTSMIVRSSISLAESYIQESARNLQNSSLEMVEYLDAQRTLYNVDRSGFLRMMTQQAVSRNMVAASLIKENGETVARADIRTNIDIPTVARGVLNTASDGKPVLIPPEQTNLLSAVIKLREMPGLYLYAVRPVDADILNASRAVTQQNAGSMSSPNQGIPTQLLFALLYFGLTLTLLLSAIWTGIAVADRLVRPIRLLIGAAGDVATGNLDVSVPVHRSDGDVGSLSQTFNTMVRQIGTQRNDLVSAKDQIDERRRFSEAVLSGVTAGVVSVNGDGIVEIINRSAQSMLGLDPATAGGKNLSALVPEIGLVFEVARATNRSVYREQVAISRHGSARTFNVQITMEDADAAEHSYVVTVDDITDLVEAQRSSAWADVARRIAHEIKNPLTPIQLSAERLRRRFGKAITQDREVFDQCTETIIRQVGDIGRMVDEFSSFARMPKPEMRLVDLREALKEASFLVEVSRSDIRFERDFADEPLMGMFDPRLMGQAFGNVIKNAAEAVESVVKEGHLDGHILVRCRAVGEEMLIEILDNGKGLPREHRQRLLEPYMTTREKGTGLGLAIVKKIVEDHAGQLELHDAPEEFYGGRGAMIRMVFPRVRPDNHPEEQVNSNGI
ncbi:PAS domain-containing sensor histidine kinase [Phyllobacterium sp. 21LDTY02-6]|uniref:sensor histidine kinase NtrY-like n=1 Tax=Phyllobacterium sp. 21LDTY02-6 TaxID=2944903 RepID=UPI002021F428|nr:PAS domain-containing sensor histidine kinase [Phyllobacterium sp. 21LDTY02-6]MCO4316555.1 PAS domain-containing sensor histidine kinase [Phyllobacterium sp. 21LDTY02-6]